MTAATGPVRGVWRSTLSISLLVLVFLWIFHSGRVLLGTNDEGIYLDAAQRMVEGQKPYVDFWGYMSPGSFWTHEWSFRLGGVTQRAGRLPVIVSFALECGVLFGLVSLLASPRAAVLTTLLFFAFQTSRLTILTSQHRWESGALAALGVLLVITGALAARPAALAAAGAAMAFAAVCTPSMGVLAALTLVWLIASGRRGRLTWAFTAGAAATGCLALGAMYWGGYLGGFLEEMRWLGRKYSSANVMPYGSIIGGYPALFADASGMDWVVRLIVVFFLVLPATLPPLAAGGWGMAMLKRRELPLPRDLMVFLLLSMAGLILTAFPRADVEHLIFIAVLPYALAAALVAHQFSPRMRGPVVGLLSFGAVLFFWNSWMPLTRDQRIVTPVGNVRASSEEAGEITRLLEVVKPGDTLYVHPYRPLFYFLTQGRNPARYSYLAPGMMDEEDERAVLADLESRPPKWVLFLELTHEEYLRVFPAGDKGKVQFTAIESWIRAGYRPAGFAIGGYGLWSRR
jgi:hypothetical protein